MQTAHILNTRRVILKSDTHYFDALSVLKVRQKRTWPSWRVLAPLKWQKVQFVCVLPPGITCFSAWGRGRAHRKFYARTPVPCAHTLTVQCYKGEKAKDRKVTAQILHEGLACSLLGEKQNLMQHMQE